MPKEQGSVPLYKLEEIANNWFGHFTIWITPSLSDRSVKSLSETAVTHRPLGVIIVGIYMSSNIYYLLLLYEACRHVSATFSQNFCS